MKEKKIDQQKRIERIKHQRELEQLKHLMEEDYYVDVTKCKGRF